RANTHLVLATPLVGETGQWENPRPEFIHRDTALAHVSVQPDKDGVTRSILLEQHTGKDRRWVLPLETFRTSRGADKVEESLGMAYGHLADKALIVGSTRIPVRLRGDQRLMRVRFFPKT